MLPTIRQLEAFIAVARNRTFSRAASEIHMSQPALSQAIAQLESILGAPLFTRTKRAVVMTDATKAFLVRAERVTATLEAAVKDFQSAADPTKGKVVIACMSLIATRLLPQVVMNFRAALPGASVVVWDDYSPRILTAVKNGEADFGITTLLEHPTWLECETIMEEGFHFICQQTHRLAGTRVEWSDLATEEFVTTREDSSILAAMLNAGIDRSIFDRSIYHVGRVTSVVEIVAQGGGVSVVPQLALGHERNHEKLYSCEMRNPAVTRKIELIRAVDMPLSPAAMVFRDLLMQALHDGAAGRRASSQSAGP